MSNQPRPDNPARNVRIEDGLWSAAKAKARRDGTTVSVIIRDALAEYVGHVR